MRRFCLTAALVGAAAAAAWAASVDRKSLPPKPKLRSGYAAEAAPPPATESAAETVESTVKTLQTLQSSPLMTPQMREQIGGIIEQAEGLDENVGSAEYGRPSRGAGAALEVAGARGRPADLCAPVAPAADEVGRRAAPVDLTGDGERDSRHAGASAAGVPLIAPPPSRRSEGLSQQFLGPPAAQRTAFDRQGLKARERLLKEPTDAAALESLAGSELAAGRFEQAAAAADQALEANPSSADAFMLRAMAREAMGDMRGAVADARQAARIDPGRHGSRAAAAEAGARLFDPSSAESWGLLEKMAAPPAAGGGFPWALLLGLVAVAAGGGTALGVRALWKDLPAESRRRVLSVLPPALRPTPAPRLGAATPLPQRAPAPLRPGGRLGSKYELIRALGRDGTVEVWKAHDTLLERDVLLKRLYVGRDSQELDLRRQEARQAATLHHPNIAELFEIAELPEGLFAVYEYASGRSLADILKEKGTLSVRQARDVLVPVCRALEHAHRRGVVHGGLSPDRVVVTRQGYVKVMDFVLARTMTAGASEYAAPEIKRGDPSSASDVYSAAMILHRMLAGALPGEGSWEPAGQVAALLEKSLDLDARTRLASAREMLEALRAVRADTLPPRAATPVPVAPEAEERLTSEPEEEERLAAGDAVGPDDPDSPLIDPGPPTHPTNPG
jgi:hypothetical protein